MQTEISRRAWLKHGAAAAAGLVVTGSASTPGQTAGRIVGQADELQGLLEELIGKHKVPGAVAGVSVNGVVQTAAAGTANLNTGAPMTPSIGFLAGSITKVWTTTLAMTFVDEGTVRLDTPLIQYLPHLRFADAEATRAITLKHLLNHSSGLDVGDYVVDRGEGPCAHRIYVDALAKIGQIHRAGAYSSYCNGGFVVVAHLLETLTGERWRKLLIDRVITPMGLTRTFVDAEDAVIYGVAVGSLPDQTRPGGHVAVPKFLLPKTMAPVGTTLVSNVDDILRFARMHLAQGVAENGKRILSAESARAMATRTIDSPSGSTTGVGLGWQHAVAGGRTVISHGGGSNGGRSLVMAIPDLKLALASFVNSSEPGDFETALHDRLTAQYGGEAPHAPDTTRAAEAAAAGVDPTKFLGMFRRMSGRTTVKQEGGKLRLESEFIPAECEGTEAYGIPPTAVYDVVPISPNTLAQVSGEPGRRGKTWTFLDPDTSGKFRLMLAGTRLARRITS